MRRTRRDDGDLGGAAASTRGVTPGKKIGTGDNSEMVPQYYISGPWMPGTLNSDVALPSSVADGSYFFL